MNSCIEKSLNLKICHLGQKIESVVGDKAFRNLTIFSILFVRGKVWSIPFTENGAKTPNKKQFTFDKLRIRP